MMRMHTKTSLFASVAALSAGLIPRSHALISSSKESIALSPTIRFRPGTSSDEWQISTTMAQEFMNPFGIQSKRFIVAVNPQDGGILLGWAQLKPLGTKSRDPNQYDAALGSLSLENEIEDEIWDEFERDEIDIPNGLESLPWTKEYRAASEAAASRRRKRKVMLEKAQAVAKEEKKNVLWELSSVYVQPPYRGNGVGTELVRRLLQNHIRQNRSTRDIYLLTLDRTQDWYTSLNFELTQDIPKAMQLEMAAGSVLTKMLGEKVICMKGK